MGGASHQNAVHATFGWQRHGSNVVVAGVLLVGRVEQIGVFLLALLQIVGIVARADATYPAALAPESKVNHGVGQRTTTALLVEHLNLNKRHVGSVGLEALRILNGGELQLIGFSGGLDGIRRGPPFGPRGGYVSFAVAFVANGFECAWLIAHAVESEEPLIRALALAHRLVVDEELHLVAC